MYPCIVIDKKKLVENAEAIVKRTSEKGVTVTAITKCIAGNVEMAEAFVEAGITKLGDSRVRNLEKMKHIDCEKWLIRIPMLSECSQVVDYADVSLNSELETIQKLNEEAINIGKVHGVVLMIDVGDLREGVFLGAGSEMSEENLGLSDAGESVVHAMVETILQMKGIELRGLGVNSTCFGATIPIEETYDQVIKIAQWIEQTQKIKCEIISGGNSSCYYLFEEGRLPQRVNNMRLGELLLLGQETAYLKAYPYLHQDSFVLEVEIVEIKEKPSYPIGLIGLNSFGEKVEFDNKGIRTRAIAAIGKQDVLLEHLTPKDEGVTIEGGSSDHMIIDTTNSIKSYKVGDVVEFTCDYASVLALCTSEYVETKVK